MCKVYYEGIEDSLGFQDENTVESRLFMESLLYKVAKEHTEKALEAAKKYGRSKSNEEFEHALQAIILSATLLESFVNYYGQIIFGEEEWKTYDKNIKPCLSQKWQKLINQVCVIDENVSFKKLEKVSKKRNYIIHHKQFFDDGKKIGKNYITTARAIICANEAKQLFDITKITIQKYFICQKNEIPKWIN